MLAFVEKASRAQRQTKAVDRIEARLPAETKQVIEQAAILLGVTLSDFVITQAYDAAQHVIQEREKWTLNRAQSRAFVESLLNPPKPNEALKKAAERYKSR